MRARNWKKFSLHFVRNVSRCNSWWKWTVNDRVDDLATRTSDILCRHLWHAFCSYWRIALFHVNECNILSIWVLRITPGVIITIGFRPIWSCLAVRLIRLESQQNERCLQDPATKNGASWPNHQVFWQENAFRADECIAGCDRSKRSFFGCKFLCLESLSVVTCICSCQYFALVCLMVQLSFCTCQFRQRQWNWTGVNHTDWWDIASLNLHTRDCVLQRMRRNKGAWWEIWFMWKRFRSKLCFHKTTVDKSQKEEKGFSRKIFQKLSYLCPLWTPNLCPWRW